MDRYGNFFELKAMEREGVDYRVCVVSREPSPVVVLAPHGGGIEPGTSELARKIAGEDLSLALFEGLKSENNLKLHITATNFDEPRCLALVQANDTVVAIHGEKSPEQVVFLGGREQELGAEIQKALKRQGYIVNSHESPELQGMAAANICNRGRRRAGVQLELSLGLRETFFTSLSADGRKKPTDGLANFADAVREGLRSGGVLRYVDLKRSEP